MLIIMVNSATEMIFTPRWYTVAQVAQMLNYGESKVRMLIITGRLRSIKDGRSRRILPGWGNQPDICPYRYRSSW